MRHGLRAARLWPGRLPGPAHRHDLAAGPGRPIRRSGSCTSRHRPRSSRRSGTATTTASCSSTAPYSQRDLHAPDEVAPRTDEGDFVIHVRSSDRITAYHYRHHPFDVVGWDGYLWPFRFNIGDFQPITGRVHQPPPVHQTFQARNFVVCSFVPRKFDYHPLAIPAPYNHSNINSDEVIYYVAGNFMSRRGVEIASFTLHPAGIPHGPHPGTVEASIGKESTEELAVMVDTFHPLRVTPAAMDLDDPRYPYSWLPPEEPPARRTSSANAVPRRSPTDRPAPAGRGRRPLPREPAHRPGPPGPWCGCVAGSVAEAAPMPRSAPHTLVALTALVVSTAMWTAGGPRQPIPTPMPMACPRPRGESGCSRDPL